ncbi:vanadium-dependent haloperoxidase [Kribbella jiaozuonensis]|uniref:Vanadium-dependent haloperoxidase n=1 Tax=Kribbella jiaozuonensis TaxID=2575441 RepID=A0A4U3LUI8_9ACTN|nr:vanadium-dependent haloperoxidase [Kribbella jiaozuonensis]TKK79788.1 vanadium-dependent haloperoxidase [Kribbella jiaozuonensis]
MRLKAWRLLVVVLTIGLVTPALVAAPSQAGGVRAGPAVITQWNTIAGRTIYAENATPVPVGSLYFGFVSLAVYDAVVAIEGRYEPYLKQPKVRARASSEAAAATAAYEVLRYYFPASATNLATDYAASLGTIPDGRAKTRGTEVGRHAAQTLIQARANDGRGANIQLTVTPAPGVWRPTPDALAPMLAPWLGFVVPLALRSPTQFRLPGPYRITSKAYARDFAEVKSMGALVGSARTPAQTETAVFWNANAVLQYQTALRGQVTARGMDIVDSARAFALLSTSVADALIACWRAKYDYAYWRPITAIRLADTDGNPATEADASWMSLLQTPPYPDYVSGHASITGAATGTFSYLFGARSLNLDVPALVSTASRHFDSAAALDAETMNARIWLGFHFRKAMTDANQLGHRSASWTIGHEFQPRHH